jgi:nucleoside-diphosphate-sugar epimerase
MRSNANLISPDAYAINSCVDFRSLDGANIAISGATGLLGTHLLASLMIAKETLNLKLNVTGLCHSTPSDYTSAIAERGRFALRNNPPYPLDVIIHAAGYAQPSVFLANPAETIRLNTELTQDLFKSLVRNGRFLFVSSSEVYSGLTGVVNESQIGTTNPYHPRSCYIEGKRCGEAICNAFYKSGVRAKSARLSLAYGPGTRQGDKRAMSQFIEQALTTGVIQMNYSGLERRTFCYIRDAVETLWQICLHGKQQVYNVGSPVTATMYDVVRLIAKQTNSIVRGYATEELPGSPEGAQMSIDLAEKEFVKDYYVGLEEGVRRTIKWQESFHHAV